MKKRSRISIVRPCSSQDIRAVGPGLAAAHALAGHDNEARGDAEKLKSFAPNLSTDLLIEQFGRHKTSRCIKV